MTKKTNTANPKPSILTFTHSGTVVNDKGSDIFVIRHGEIEFVIFDLEKLE